MDILQKRSGKLGNPGHFDPRQYLGPAREEMKKLYIHKIVKVLGSNNKL